MHRLLAGTEAGRDLLGLVAAAGGGLSSTDLAELTGAHDFEIQRLLNAVNGRTFATRLSPWRQGMAPQVYVFAHEDLQLAATEILGGSLTSYRRQLRAWAGRYRAQSWPAETPEYLLRGYFQMLQAAGEESEMVECALDGSRHDRMLNISGGDNAALREISAAQDAILAQRDPDLTAMGRLAVHRDELAERNESIPFDLPATWAALGQTARADALARSFHGPYEQANALGHIARRLWATGQSDQAAEAADHAVTIALSIADHDARGRALGFIVRDLLAAGQYDRAEAIARSITGPETEFLQALALQNIAEELLSHGQYVQAEGIALSITDPYTCAQVAGEVAEKLAAAGQRERAADVARHAEAAAWSGTNYMMQPTALSRAAGALVITAQYDRAETIASSMTDPYTRAWVTSAIARVLAAAGQPERAAGAAEQAEAVTRSLGADDPGEYANALVHVASALAAAGKQEQAAIAGNRAEKVARSSARDETSALIDVAMLWANTGHYDKAEAIARSVKHEKEQAKALNRIADALAIAGLFERAEALARSIPHPGWQMAALDPVVKALIAAGKFDHAEVVTRSLTDVSYQAKMLNDLAEALATAGQRDRAGRLRGQAEKAARAITNLHRQSHLLGQIAWTLLAAGLHDQARAAARESETVARSITDPRRLTDTLKLLAEALITAKQYDKAEEIAQSIAERDRRASVLMRLVKALVAAGEHDRVVPTAEKAAADAQFIKEPHEQENLLTSLAISLAAAGEDDKALTAAQG